MSDSPDISIDDIRRAAERLRGQIENTPCLHSRTLSQITGAEVYLKFENLQFTASFKERGAYNRMSRLTAEERARGVIAVSAGNHAQGVAYHAQRMNVPAVIVMPKFTPMVKVERTRGFGAEIVLVGETFDDTKAEAERLAAERGLTMVHPYDDPDVIAGQGTVALEMLAAQPQLDCLCVPIGGGGLISGVAVAAKSIKPDLHLIGVQVSASPSAYLTLKEKKVYEHYKSAPTIAEGLAGGFGRLPYQAAGHLIDEVVLVDEDELYEGIYTMLAKEQLVVEASGVVGVSALLANKCPLL